SVNLPTMAGLVGQRGVETGPYCAATRPMEKMPHTQPRFPAQGQNSNRWDRPKIATDVVGNVESLLPRRPQIVRARESNAPLSSLQKSPAHGADDPTTSSTAVTPGGK